MTLPVEATPSAADPSPEGPDPDPRPLGFPTGPRRGGRRQMRLIAAALVIASLLIAALARTTNPASSGEIFLSPADSAGADTFAPSIAAPAPTSTVAPLTSVPAPRSGGVARSSGAAPGLYAGVRNASPCDTARLVSFLADDPTRARAWSRAAGVETDDIGAYVGSLTPVLTRVDARVTDYGFRKGKPVPSQSVLQGGTAVLVDRFGVPRVRCASGNPLGEPQAVPATPRYNGPRWPGFTPGTIIVIAPAASPATIIVLFDPATGLTFVRIPGSIVIIDLDPLAPGTVLVVAEPGGPVTITGTRWPSGALLELRFDDPADLVATVAADGAGNFATTVTVPLAARPGVHQVTITGGGFSLPAPVYVIPPRPRVGARTGR